MTELSLTVVPRELYYVERKLVADQADEIKRLQEAKRRALSIADERSKESAALRDERDRLYGYVNGLLGLLQLVRGRDDMPHAIAEVLRTNHRATDAAAYLTQIVPPASQ